MSRPTASPSFSRRSLLKGAGLTALAVMGPSALAGCASAVGEQRSGPESTGTPTRGGVLKAGITNDIVPANFLTNTGAAPFIIGLAYDSLIRYGNDSVEPRPHLATGWELSPDGLSLALDLRQDVVFHSGRPFTSKDAEFSLRTYADPKWTAQLQSTGAAITGYDTSAPHRIVLQFAHPLGNIFDLLDTVPILDSESIDQLAAGSAFIGTGPFRLSARTPNSSLTFERNEQYWIPERPYLDGVEIQIVPDAQTLYGFIRSGSVHFAHGLSYRDNEALAQTQGFAATRLEGAEHQLYLGTNVQHPSLKDVGVRRAIAYAVDRQRIIDEVFRGAGYPVNLPWPRSSSAYDEASNTRFSRDLTKAREQLAGKQVSSIPLTFQSRSPSHAQAAEIIQANLAEIGVPVQLDPVENAAFVAQLIGQKFSGLWVTNHSWAQYTPSTLAVSAYPFNARRNASRFESPEYTKAAEDAWKVADGRSPEAVDRYRAVSEQLLEHLFLIEIGVVFNQFSSAASLQNFSWTKRSEPLLQEAYLT